jgi:hypothetical protein
MTLEAALLADFRIGRNNDSEAFRTRGPNDRMASGDHRRSTFDIHAGAQRSSALFDANLTPGRCRADEAAASGLAGYTRPAMEPSLTGRPPGYGLR